MNESRSELLFASQLSWEEKAWKTRLPWRRRRYLQEADRLRIYGLIFRLEDAGNDSPTG